MQYFQQTQPQQFDKDQAQGSYPPGFNPQDMASMYQMPLLLIPQPNGTTLLQPMYQMVLFLLLMYIKVLLDATYRPWNTRKSR